MSRRGRTMMILVITVIPLAAIIQGSGAERQAGADHLGAMQSFDPTGGAQAASSEAGPDSERLDQPPIVRAPVEFTGCQNKVITFKVTASDPNGDAIQSLTADFSGLPKAHHAKFKTNATNTVGTLRWRPTFIDARITPYVVIFTAKNSLSGSAKTAIIVDDTF